jgi:transposase-like protein
MRKNQKYTQEEMYMAIELWQESGLSLKKFCIRENISSSTFSYWLRKFRNEVRSNTESAKNFIPVTIGSDQLEQTQASFPEFKVIFISYPNGVQVNCPLDIANEKLQALIRI